MEKHKWRAYERSVLKRMLGTERDRNVTETLRKLLNQELDRLCSSPNVIGSI
jgi:hypothetical protein